MLGRRLDDTYPAAIRHGLTTVTGARLATNAVSRYLGPFVATVAAGLDITVGRLGVAIAIAEGCGLASPLLGNVIDRIDHRRAMLIGLVGSAVAALLLATSERLPGSPLVGFGAALVLFTVAKIFYDVALGRWVADHVPYARRGRVIGFVEMSWALGLLVGVSLMGLITAWLDWRWAYGFAAVATAALTVATATRLRPASRAGTGTDGASPRRTVAEDGVDAGASRRRVGELSALETTVVVNTDSSPEHRQSSPRRRRGLALGRRGWFAVATMFAMCAAAQVVFITFGAWLQDEHGFSATMLAVVTFALGVLELGSSGLASSRTDRWGKERSVLGGVALMVASGAALVALASSVAGLALVIVFIAGFEFAIVSLLPMGGELVTGRPATGIGLFLAATASSRAVATIPATQLFESVGFWACAVLAVALAAAAAATLQLRGNL